MEIGEADALCMELVHVRRLEKRMPVRPHVAIALIIGQDDEDIGFVGLRGERACRRQ